MGKKFAENEFVTLWSENGFLYIEYKPETCINLPAAKEIMGLLSSFCKEESYLVLQDMNDLKWIDKASRDYIASHPLTSQMKAWAYHAKNPLHQVMYNIYVTFSKPQVRTAFFLNMGEGIQWLREIDGK